MRNLLTNRKTLIVANWKCNPTTLKGANLLFDLVKRGIRNVKNVEVVICPPFVYLRELGIKKELEVKLGAQNCFWENSGAFTGEVSPTMLKDLGVEYVIIGHSERRRYFQESNEIINKKLKAVIKTKLKPILCIGETEKERKLGKTFEVLETQLSSVLKNCFEAKHKNKLIVAYEPVWAIGIGNPCQPAQAKEVLIFLRKIFKKSPILYGGSVNLKNAKDYIETADFDGLLIGGASLDAKEFIKIVKNINRA